MRGKGKRPWTATVVGLRFAYWPRDRQEEVRRWVRDNPGEYDLAELDRPRDPVTGESIGYDRMESEAVTKHGPRVWSTEKLLDAAETEVALSTNGAHAAWLQPHDFYSPAQKLELQTWRARLEFLVDRLKPAYRDLITDHFLLGHRQSDIARARGRRRQTIHGTLARAIEKMRLLAALHAEDLARVLVDDPPSVQLYALAHPQPEKERTIPMDYGFLDKEQQVRGFAARCGPVRTRKFQTHGELRAYVLDKYGIDIGGPAKKPEVLKAAA